MSKPVQPTTLCVLRDGENILLAMKKRGFGAGKWNGYGGKIYESESVEDSLIREVKEESNLDLISYEKRGEIEFHYNDYVIHMIIFEGTQWQGEPEETEEMSPKWYTVDSLPFPEMWPDDMHWFPHFLSRNSFSGKVEFSDDHQILSIDVKLV